MQAGPPTSAYLVLTADSGQYGRAEAAAVTFYATNSSSELSQTIKAGERCPAELQKLTVVDFDGNGKVLNEGLENVQNVGK